MTDARGTLFEAVKGGGGGQVFLSTTAPGVTRGDHFHLTKVERFLVVQGEAIIRIRKVLSNEVWEYRVSGDSPAPVDMPTFCFLGSGVNLEALKQQAADLGLSNAVFLPRVPGSEVRAFLDAADCLLVHLRDTTLFEITLPSKTQAYMYAGKPVLMGVRGEAARLIERAACGITVTPENPESIASGAIALAEMPRPEREKLGQNGRAFYERELSMQRGMQKYSEIYNLVRRA